MKALRLLLASIIVTAIALACSSPDKDARTDPIGPDRAQFNVVSRVLVFHCGTLDCHGSTHKNLRLYGYGGLRLGDFRPDEGGVDLRPIEVDANYESVIGLEPEIMRQVVLEKGERPERLSLVRKARGTEEHKGRDPFKVGDFGDRCLTSWLRNAVDRDACINAVDDLPLPDGGL